MKIYSQGLSKADAAKKYAEIKNDYPKYAVKARNLVIKCLRDQCPERLDVFLGYKDEFDNRIGVSIDRIFTYSSVRYICKQMERVDRENLHGLWTEGAWNWYARRLLKLPFRTVDSIEDNLSLDIGGIHTQELMKSIVVRLW